MVSVGVAGGAEGVAAGVVGAGVALLVGVAWGRLAGVGDLRVDAWRPAVGEAVAYGSEACWMLTEPATRTQLASSRS